MTLPIRALDLAALTIGLSDPNQRFGCVITTPDGRAIAKGHTKLAYLRFASEYREFGYVDAFSRLIQEI